MIKNIIGGGGIEVAGMYTSMPYVNSNSSNPMQGMLRLYNNDMQVFDGTSWITISASYPTISLNGVAQSAIAWAQAKMAEEESIKKLAEKHPAVADAMNTINEAYDKLKVIVALTEEENK